MTDNRHISHRHASGDQAAGLNLTSASPDGCSKHREHGEVDHRANVEEQDQTVDCSGGGDGAEDEQGLEPGARGGGLPLLQVSLQEPLPLREAPSLL